MKYSLKLFILITIVSIAMTSCKDAKSEKGLPLKIETKEKTVVEPVQALNVLLDNGKKWKANIETTAGIAKMQELLEKFAAKENVEKYNLLKIALEIEFTTIFQKCTMKGESHNQLHNFLKPMLPIFEGLESAELLICKGNFDLLNTHLKEYKIYFE